nr:potassium transporter TrkG [Smaragdicoccus niigatensis]
MATSARPALHRRLLPHNPGKLVALAFAAWIALGTAALMLPISTAEDRSTGLVTALFTATGASCGALAVVDTQTHWSTFGQVVIMILVQIGGLGIMTLASLLTLLVARKIGLRMQLVAASEAQALQLGDTKLVLKGVIGISLVVEAVVAFLLFARFLLSYSYSPGKALFYSVFHAITSYNNAGYALYSDNLMSFQHDAWVLVPVMVGCVLGGLGFPVIFELTRALRRARVRPRVRRTWTVHTKITLWTYGLLVVVGFLTITALEWGNPGTLGPMGAGAKMLNGMFASITARTAGFNSIDYGHADSTSLLITDCLMIIGGGSASSAGGIKVTTFALLGFVMLAEIRGEPSVHVMGRRLPLDVQRQALTVTLLSVGAVVVGTVILDLVSPAGFEKLLFEAISAFGTVGLSTGITPDLPAAGQLVLVGLMFLGRVGPIALASALALRRKERRFEYPEERPIVG